MQMDLWAEGGRRRIQNVGQELGCGHWLRCRAGSMSLLSREEVAPMGMQEKAPR